MPESDKEITAELFSEFWRLYPKREGKKPAWDKFCKLSVDEQRLVVNHVRERVESDVKWTAGYVPMPTTFFNQRRWEDEYETAKPKKSKTPSQPLTICPDCRSTELSQRHRDICNGGLEYYDGKIGNRYYRLNSDGSGVTYG